MAFTTQPDTPVALFSLGAATLGTQATFEMFVGGAVSGGASLVQYPLNHYQPDTPPFILIAGGVTIDTPGTLIAAHFILGNRGDIDIARGGGHILAPGTPYQVTLTNNDNQTATMFLDVLAGKMI